MLRMGGVRDVVSSGEARCQLTRKVIALTATRGMVIPSAQPRDF